MQIPNDCDYLIEEFGERMWDRYRALLSEIQEILTALGLTNSDVRVDRNLLSCIVLDYFADIYRLKKFHKSIKRVNVEKIYAYTIYWLLRRKPVQLLRNVDIDATFVNEQIAVTMMLAKLSAEMGVSMDTSTDAATKRIIQFGKLMLYNFKYRLFTQQSLELMAEGFMAGCHLCIEER